MEDTEVKDSDKEVVKPKSTIIEEKEFKSTNLEDTQKESTNEETIESGSTVETYEDLKSTTLENVQAKTTNVVEKKSTNLPDIEIKSTNEELIQIESTNFEEVQLKTTNIEDNGIKSTTMKEIKVETTITEKKTKKENISEYADIVDFLEEKVEINPIFNIDYIKDADICEDTGKFILVGAPTDNITEDVKFDLPLTYPNDILKCEMIKSKKNDKIEIICKSLFGFKNVENIIFEQRLISKKNKEIVIIPKKQIKLNKMINCIDYN